MRPCCSCGSVHSWVTVSADGQVLNVMCQPCWDARIYLVPLGHAIARFCRRADMIDRHDDIDAVDRAIKQHDDALSRLAALAMEVES